MDAWLVSSDSLDAWANLAIEDYLMAVTPPTRLVLFLWRSANAVVIGKHQNPWRECDLGALAAGGGQLARRSSGGGAVYQDAGNLNFCFVTGRVQYDREALQGLVIAALARLGIDAQAGGRHQLLAAGRKVSGSAFGFRRGMALYHGTLLCTSDLERLGRCLTETQPIPETKAIASVPESVANLSNLYPGTTVEAVQKALSAEFRAHCGGALSEVAGANLGVAELRRQHASWEWQFGQTPPFVATVATTAGPVVIEVQHGLVTRCTVAGRPLLPEAEALARRQLEGTFPHLRWATPVL